MGKAALATIARDLEAKAVVHIAKLGKIRTPNIDLRCCNLGRRVGRQPRPAVTRYRIEMKLEIRSHVGDGRANATAGLGMDRTHRHTFEHAFSKYMWRSVISMVRNHVF